MFFTLSIVKPKTGRAKKGRASTASRLSTQSNFTAVTDGVSIAETEVNHDESMVSTTDTIKSMKSNKGAKRANKGKKASSKAKGKVAKAKQEQSQITSSFLEPEDDDFEVKIAQVVPPSRTSKKRKSEEISTAKEDPAESQSKTENEEPQPRPRKRQATKTRNSVALAQELPTSASQDEDEVDTHMIDTEEMGPPPVPASKKKTKGRRKKASSTTRKVSTASTASKASLRAAILDDDDIDAVLEAELGRPLTDEEGDLEPLETKQPRSRRLTRTRPGSEKATASVAPIRRGTRASTVTVDNKSIVELNPTMLNASDVEREPLTEKPAEATPAEETVEPSSNTKKTRAKGSRKASARKPNRKQDVEAPEESKLALDENANLQVVVEEELQQRGTRQTSQQLLARNARASVVPGLQGVTDLTSDVNTSLLDNQTAQEDSGHETDASVVKQGRAKRGSRKATTAAKKEKGGKKGIAASRNIEDIVQPNPEERISGAVEDQPDVRAIGDEAINIERQGEEIEAPEEQPKTTKVTTKATKGKKSGPKSKASTRKVSAISSSDEAISVAEGKASPPPVTAHSTPRPALSAQSSDAENQPPSSRPSAQRPPLSLQSPPNHHSLDCGRPGTNFPGNTNGRQGEQSICVWKHHSWSAKRADEP